MNSQSELCDVRAVANVHPQFVSLAVEGRVTVETDCAAYHLNREAQTLRGKRLAAAS